MAAGNVTRVELGHAGHFICADRCLFRRHTQAGNFRVSTVGDFYPANDKGRESLSAVRGTYFETMVFRTVNRPGGQENCGCRKLVDLKTVDFTRYRTAGEAQKGHEAFVEKYLKVSRKRGARG